MKRWLWAGVGLVFLFGVGVAWLLASSNSVEVETREVTQAEPPVPANAPATSPAATTGDVSPAKQKAQAEARWRARLSGEFQRVADIYEQKSQFPPYSFPIGDGDLPAYQYNHYVPVNVPMDTPAGSVQLRVVLEELHFQKGQPIVGMVAVSGEAAGRAELDDAQLINRNNEALMSQALQPAGDRQYSILLEPSEARARDWPRDLLVKVTGQVGGNRISAVAPVFYEAPVGEVDSVGAAAVDGAHLVIPVSLELAGEGDYRISGNLYSESGQPLVHIEHDARLSKFDNKTKLKVHRAALEAAGDPGPYQLKDLMVRQLPAKPGDVTRFGPVVDKAFDVDGFAFDRYADTPYEDPLRQARLEFLRNASEL
ncbi:hypothetical protein QQM79_08400 [Marinobacteraceae bacterium S3BR75-40.1]